MKKLKYLLITLVFALPGIADAQDAAAETRQSLFEQYQVEIVLGLAVVVCCVAVVAMFVVLMAMKTMVHLRKVEMGIEEETSFITVRESEEGVGFWERFWNRFNESVPVTKEETVVTDHEYDGIKELDNSLPPWWLYGFYVSIIFAVAYLVNYHVAGSGLSQDEEFEQAMEQAEEEVQLYLASMGNLMDENTVELTLEPSELAAGKTIFETNCAVCHAKDGGGGVGPNFTDKYWLNGGDIKSIFKTIKYGVPSKGMISWESQLSPKKIQQVSSYIYTMEGTTAGNPKESQGELFERATEGEEASADTTKIASTDVGI